MQHPSQSDHPTHQVGAHQIQLSRHYSASPSGFTITDLEFTATPRTRIFNKPMSMTGHLESQIKTSIKQ